MTFAFQIKLSVYHCIRFAIFSLSGGLRNGEFFQGWRIKQDRKCDVEVGKTPLREARVVDILRQMISQFTISYSSKCFEFRIDALCILNQNVTTFQF